MTLSTLIFGMCDMKPPFPSQGCLGSCGQMCWRKPMHRINSIHNVEVYNSGVWPMPSVTLSYNAIQLAYRNGEKRDVPYRMWESIRCHRGDHGTKCVGERLGAL